MEDQRQALDMKYET